ncbi:MAG: hypothetical protein RJB15_278, partial [Pseudomonadota bacterium]
GEDASIVDKVLAIDEKTTNDMSTEEAIKLIRVEDMKRMTDIIQGSIKHEGSKATIYSECSSFGGIWISFTLSNG